MTIRIGSLLAAAALVIGCGKGADKKGDTKVTEGSNGSGGTSGTAGSATKTPTQAPPRGPEHAVYSLVDNRLSAHLIRNGGLYLPAGSAGFAKYVRFDNSLSAKFKPTWKLRQTHGDARVAHMNGTSATVVVPLTAADIQNPTVRVHAFNDATAARAFSVRVNGNKDVNGQLQPGANTVELAVPPGQLKEGENQLLFFVGGGAGLDVQSIQVGGSAAADDGAATFYRTDSKHLVLPSGGGMAWYVHIPEKARLTADLPDGACSLAVTATGEDGAQVHEKLTGLGGAVDLGELGGKAARIQLVADGCPSAEVGNAALVLAGAAPAAPARGEPPKYVVLFIMDSLRADHVKAFSPDARPDAPTWSKLAETSAIFLNTYVQGNESRVSHASIWSSLYPVKHRMIGEKDKLDLKWTTVDEVAKGAGKYVVGVSANGYIRPARGFGSAWDKYSNHIEEETGLKAEDIYDHGVQFLTGKEKTPWFLYLGTVDTHVSWRAKEPWMSKYDPGYKGRFADTFGGADAGAAASGKMQLTPDEIKHVRALYDCNVSYQDAILDKLVQKLTEWGVWDQTLLVVTADHGDEQWEDGRVGHGGSTRDMLIHVPLLVHYPPLVATAAVTEAAESVDIVPTIADALGAPVDPEWQGQSLIPLSHGVGGGYPGMSFNSMYEQQHAGRIGHWKVRVSGGASYRAYDLAADPQEMKDVAGQPQAAVGARMVLDALWMMRSLNPDWKKAQWGNAANVSARFAADLGE